MSFLRKHNVFSHKENMHEARIKLTYATKGKKKKKTRRSYEFLQSSIFFQLLGTKSI